MTDDNRTESRNEADVIDELLPHCWQGPSVGCARCGGQHDEVPLFWQPFRMPVAADDGSAPWTHWATCPMTGDPILSRSTEKGG